MESYLKTKWHVKNDQCKAIILYSFSIYLVYISFYLFLYFFIYFSLCWYDHAGNERSDGGYYGFYVSTFIRLYDPLFSTWWEQKYHTRTTTKEQPKPTVCN